MTTIAYKKGVMAGDGRMTGSFGVIATDNSPKVYKLKNGGIAGGAGVPALTQAYVEWLEHEIGEAPGLASDGESRGDIISSRVLLVRPDGRIEMHEHRCVTRLPADEAYAMGSGRDFALAAMSLGAPPRDAVRIATRFDSNSGGTITEVSLSC